MGVRDVKLGGAKRCSLCGAPRTRAADGGWGACSLIGCKDPLHDCREEEARAAAEELRGMVLCSCGKEPVTARSESKVVAGVEHRYGKPCRVAATGGELATLGENLVVLPAGAVVHQPTTSCGPCGGGVCRLPAATPEPPPKRTGRSREVLPDLIAMLKERSDFGLKKYGTRLETFNGREAHLDALQELLDLFVYMHQAQMEAYVLGCRELTFRLNLERRVEALKKGEKVNGEVEFLEELLKTARNWEG